jgi:hypothetical protein
MAPIYEGKRAKKRSHPLWVAFLIIRKFSWMGKKSHGWVSIYFAHKVAHMKGGDINVSRVQV